MTKINRTTLMLLIVVSCLGCDQVSKRIAQNTLQYERPKTFLGETFRLEYAENTGAFLSLGADLSKTARTWLFTILSGALLVALFAYILLNKGLQKSHIMALSLILGGGLSNLIDRVFNDGRVIDFLNMGIGNIRTGIFNIADVVIMAGMALVLVFNMRTRNPGTDNDGEENSGDEREP